MSVNNCNETAPINLKVSLDDRNGFKACLALKNKTCKEILHQAIIKCIADTDNFLKYIYSE